jgi:hypothetical protein
MNFSLQSVWGMDEKEENQGFRELTPNQRALIIEETKKELKEVQEENSILKNTIRLYELKKERDELENCKKKDWKNNDAKPIKNFY